MNKEESLQIPVTKSTSALLGMPQLGIKYIVLRPKGINYSWKLPSIKCTEYIIIDSENI